MLFIRILAFKILSAYSTYSNYDIVIFFKDYFPVLFMCHNIVLSLLFCYYSISCMFYLLAFNV